MAQPLRWGLIGASDIAATRVLPALRRGGDSVAGVFSNSAEHAAHYAQVNELARFTTELDELLSAPIDAVYISSRNDEHAAQALAAAASGKHVLLEKPIATSLQDAQATVAGCESAGVVLAVNHHLPAAGTHRMIHRLVDDGAIGRVLSVSIHHAVMLPERLRGWRLDDVPGAGVILDITVHDAAVINRLLGSSARWVVALAARQGPWAPGAEDAAMISYGYHGEVLAQSHDAFTVGFAPTRIDVHGDAGTVSGVNVMTQTPDGEVFLRDAGGTREIEVNDRRDLYEVTLSDFRRAVAGQGRASVTGQEGLEAYAVAQAALESSRSGVRVHVPSLLEQSGRAN